MITIILSTAVSILSSCNQPTCLALDPSADSDYDVNSSFNARSEGSTDENDAYSDRSNPLDSTEYIKHYSVETKKSTYDYIDVPDNASMIERTSKYGNGYCSIPAKNIKTKLSNVDNRVPVDYSSSKNGYPFSALGMIFSQETGSNEYSSIGTIFMAPGGFGITAAHCVYNDFTGFYNNLMAGFKLSSIVDGNKFNFEYSSSITDIYVPNLYFSNVRDPDYDWAIVKFSDKTLESKTGSFSLASGFTMYDQVNTCVGFPKDKGYQPHSSSGKGVLSSSEHCYNLYQTSSKGMSGGPVMFTYFNSSTLDEFTVVTGIVSQSNPYKDDLSVLHASRVTNSLISLIRLLK